MHYVNSKIIVLFFIFLGFATASCTTVEPFDYYLDKDASHRDVYEITASIHTDGTCNFSIGEHESYEDLRWTNPAELINMHQLPWFSGICIYRPEKNTEHRYKDGTARMYITVYTSAAETYLDVYPSETLVPGDNPPGVYFSIRNPQTVREPRGVFCGLGLDSLRGEAYIQTSQSGFVTLRISALAYATDAGCS